MVNLYDDDKIQPFAERKISDINACFEDDEEFEAKAVCYNSVEPDQVENGIAPVAPYFGKVKVVESTNVHFGNKTYYQGPVTVLTQTIVSPSEVKKTNESGLPPKEKSNKNFVQKVCLALCPGSKKRQLIAAGVAVTAVLVVISVYVSIIIGEKTKSRGKGEENGSLGDTGDGHTSGVYTTPSNGSGDFIDGPNVRIRDRSEWLAQPPVEPITDLEVPAPNVIITHSATEGCRTTAECVVRVRYIQMFHIESKHWSDIGYNFLVGGEGAVYEGRGWDKVGAHSLGWNNISIGICVVGTFTTIEPTSKQLVATQKLIKLGVQLGKIKADYRLLAHSQVQSTESPGRKMLAIMQRWPHWYNTSATQD